MPVTHVIFPKQPYENVIPILQMAKVRYREVPSLAKVTLLVNNGTQTQNPEPVLSPITIPQFLSTEAMKGFMLNTESVK